MKILAINGSPHYGNTAEKIDIIKTKFLNYSDVDFEIINLKDITVKSCKGCFTCFMRGEDKCPLKDDKELIARKLEEADGVLFATPVYSMHVSYLLKNLIDRMAYTFHRPRYFGKYALVMAVAGNIGLKETLEYMKMTAIAWGFECIGEIGYTAAPKNTSMTVPPVKKDNTDKFVEQMYTAIKQRKPRKLTIRDHMTFRIMQTIYSRLKVMSPYDYNYWMENGWLDRKKKYFFGNVKHRIIGDVIARFVAWMMGRQMDKALATD